MANRARLVDGRALRAHGPGLAHWPCRAGQLALLKRHQKLAAAYAEGWQDDLLTPFLSLTRDNNLRPDLTLEVGQAQARLRPQWPGHSDGG